VEDCPRFTPKVLRENEAMEFPEPEFPEKEGLWFAEEEYKRMLGVVRLELERQIVAPDKVVKLRCWLYYKVIEDITLRWIKLRTVIDQAIDSGEIRRHRRWLTLAEFDEREVDKVYKEKKWIEEKWGSVAERTGHWFEKKMRDAFEEEGWTVGDKSQVYRWKGKKVEIDVYCSSPVRLGGEVKNESSDVYHAPTAIESSRRNEAHEKIIEKFEFCKENGITPILLASFIDKSFGGFAHNYRGLYIQTLFQFFPMQQQGLVNAIKEKDLREGFRFGNVRTIERIPDHVRRLIRAIPDELKRLYSSK